MRRNFNYLPKWCIMNRNESRFFKILELAVGYKYFILPQVHLDELIKPYSSKNSRIFSFRHINQKSVDFVICTKDTLHPLLAIELDGSSHNTEKSITRDKEVERILQEVHVPLKRFRNDEDINSIHLQKLIDQTINAHL